MNRIYSLLSLGFLLIGAGLLPVWLSEIYSFLQSEESTDESLNWEYDLNEEYEGLNDKVYSDHYESEIYEDKYGKIFYK